MSDHNSYLQLPKNIERYLAALTKLYGNDGHKNLQEIIVNSQIRVHEEWTSDNWNGGTFGHALFLVLPELIYLNSVKKKDELQTKIKEDINKIHNFQNEFIAEVFFEMEVVAEQDWRKESGLLLSSKRVVLPEAINRIWEPGCYNVFLSHKTEVKNETAILKEKLKFFGISSFVAHEDIHPTKEWQNEIENALSSMDSLVALLTDRFHDSIWTDQEVGFAFGRGVPIISVRLGKDPYGFIGKFQALSCSWDSAPKEIAKILIKHDRMLDSYINALKNCGSYDDGNMLSELLPSIDKLSNKQVSELITAFNENGQVGDSFGFNGGNPRLYGEGLLFHLKRLTGHSYNLSPYGKI